MDLVKLMFSLMYKQQTTAKNLVVDAVVINLYNRAHLPALSRLMLLHRDYKLLIPSMKHVDESLSD